ncbi:beta-propeller fold lactonase family protein [Nocardioides sp. LHD-245]|uniref:lactonase family protein n=1 Tax=Nocardioides sp. LHD-245 TaxID=3051387 RepID=UPI0027E201BF|nr:beta-propeller fold lactonase family protein [Nocardioides sp. LHD-245]
MTAGEPLLAVAAEHAEGGVEAWRLDGAVPRRVAAVRLPGAFTLLAHPLRPVLYAASSAHGALLTLEVTAGGGLDARDRLPGGDSLPCSLALDTSATRLAVAHYDAGAISLHALGPEGVPEPGEWLPVPAGTGPDPGRQDAPHPHQVRFGASGDLWATDLGTDRLLRYPPEGGAPDVVPVARGSGPRHFAWLADGRVAVVDELASRLTVLTAAGAPAGSVAIGALREGRSFPSDLAVHPSRDLVYVANRGADTVSVVDVRARPVLVQEVAVGRWPQHLLIGPDALWCAARDDDRVLRLPLHGTGLLGDSEPVLDVVRPSWLAWAGGSPWAA